MSRRGTDVVDYFQASAVCSHYEKLRNVQTTEAPASYKRSLRFRGFVDQKLNQ